MSSNSSSSSSGGVIVEPPKTEKKKQISPSKRWCFTFNNYSEDDISSLVPIFEEECVKWVFGFEVGASGTPHLQGYLVFKQKKRPLSVFADYQVHWEKTRAKEKENWDYCVKEGDYMSGGFPKPPTTIKRSDFYPWQEELVKIFEKPCPWDDRVIYWRAGDTCIGKTQFCKWMCVHLGAVVISGGSCKHILAQVQNAGAKIYIVLLIYGDHKVSYKALEQVKDGLFSTSFGCDNNSMCISDAPHLLVIGNEMPDEEDRNFHPGKYNVSRILDSKA